MSDHQDFLQGPSVILIRPPDSPNKWGCLVHHCVALAVGCPFFVAWIAVREYLEKQGIYKSLCDKSVTGYGVCTLRDSAFAQLSVIAISSTFGFAVVGGILRDALGSRKTYIIANGMVVLSMLMMYSNSKLGADEDGFKLDLYPFAFLLWGSSSEILCISIIGVQELFPKSRSKVIALLSATRSVSMIFTAVLARWNPPLNKTLIVYGMLCTLWTAYFVTCPYFSQDTFQVVSTVLDLNKQFGTFIVNCRSKEFISLVIYLMLFFSALNYVTAMIPMAFDSNGFMRDAVTIAVAFSGVIGAAIVGLLKNDQVVNLVPTFEVLSGNILLISILFADFSIAKILILINLTIFMSLPAGQVYILVCNLFPSELHGSLNGFAFLGGGFSGWLISSFLISRAESFSENGNSLLIMNMTVAISTVAAYVNIILIIRERSYMSSQSSPVVDRLSSSLIGRGTSSKSLTNVTDSLLV